jgi:proline iminopeptidase
MRPLFPPVELYRTEFLQLSDGHEIYMECSGTPHGESVLFLHGGPGSGSSPDQRRLFDPKRFNIIQFDQRGCGKSRPHGSLENNTTNDLVGDILTLLDHLKLEKVHLAGGSWGSTLALCFANEHPDRLKSLLLYGIFLGRQSELQALYFPDGIAHQLHPELFEQYLALLPVEDRQNPIEGYGRLFRNGDEAIRNEALLMWTRLEKRLSRLVVDEDGLGVELADTNFVLSHSLIENHYFRHNCFIDGNELLTTIPDKLRELPTHIIAGRYDLVCPIITAYELHKALPHSTMSIVPDAGHSFREKGITDAFIRASEALLD